MDWQGRYDRFIRQARHTYAFGASQTHHILPRSMGGTDDWDNLVRLSPRAHMHAHLLLGAAGHRTQIFAVWLIAREHGFPITRMIRRAHTIEQQLASREANRRRCAERHSQDENWSFSSMESSIPPSMPSTDTRSSSTRN